jgi:hypothetical protein
VIVSSVKYLIIFLNRPNLILYLESTIIKGLIIYKNSVRTSQKTHYITKTNQLMLFWETNAVYCENSTKRALCGQSSDFKYFKAVGTMDLNS